MKIEALHFLRQLYQRDKKIFTAVVVYAFGILYYCWHQREEFPFLLYGMYSLREKPQETYVRYTFEADGREQSYAGFLDPKRQLISSAQQNGADEYSAGRLTNEQMRALTDWLYKLYFSPWEAHPNKQLEIYQLTYAYNQDGRPQLLKRDLLYRNVRP